MAAVPVVVWSDFTCPWSYVTEAALRRLEDEGRAAPRYAAFELYPAPAPLPPPDAEWPDALRDLARAAGVELRPPVAAARTRKAHEAALFAAAKGAGRAMREAIFAAYFRDGLDVGRIDVLIELGAELGLDRSEMKAVLDIDALTGRVLGEAAAARRLGVDAVPSLVIGEGTAATLMVGAQSREALREALEQVG
ncbi:MAG TPA: DsbA family protein [Longimicrobiaceae bacterium]|nr:DsbA family protein [Longimicrobiaceae bacterium]